MGATDPQEETNVLVHDGNGSKVTICVGDKVDIATLPELATTGLASSIEDAQGVYASFRMSLDRGPFIVQNLKLDPSGVAIVFFRTPNGETEGVNADMLRKIEGT